MGKEDSSGLHGIRENDAGGGSGMRNDGSCLEKSTRFCFVPHVRGQVDDDLI